MEQLLSLLKTIPEYAAMVSSLQDGESVAVTGIGQINRSHMIAGLCRSLNRPMVVLCQDDLAARRLQEELKGFLSDTAPILPGRDLTLYDAAVVSRSWEQKRLRQLYDLAVGKTSLQIMTWESLSLRTMPKAALLAAAFSLEVGREYAVEDLTSRLTAAGYNRCGMVEGPGQFAVRGGILDIFSPPKTGLSGRNSSATSWTPWASLTRRPSAAVRTSPPSPFFPWRRLSRGFIPAVWRGCAKILPP